jgi:hypothetical protein
VFTLGGFHPAYNPEPLVFPSSLTRLAMVHGHPDDRLYLRFEGYFAVTSNTLQFGAKVEAIINAGNFNIHGSIAFDALIRFEPFHFEIDIRASVHVRYKSHNLSGLTLTGSLVGPGPVVLRAKVCIELLFFDICFSDTFTLGSSTPPPAPTISDALHVLLDELERPSTLSASTATDRHVTLRAHPEGLTGTVVSPVGQLIWVQHQAPLGVLLQRIGGTPLAKPQRVDATSVQATSSEVDWFAPGAFTDLTDDQALTRRGFERLDGGLRFGGPNDTNGPPATASLTINQIRLPAKARSNPTPHMFPAWLMAATANATNPNPKAAPPTPTVAVTQETWTATNTTTGQTITGLTSTQAHQIATLTTTARHIATPTPDRLTTFAF